MINKYLINFEQFKGKICRDLSRFITIIDDKINVPLYSFLKRKFENNCEASYVSLLGLDKKGLIGYIYSPMLTKEMGMNIKMEEKDTW
ncbi:hypothetical protein KKC91_06865 [bacterium]|nr:hypothetical protein [bacterium]